MATHENASKITIKEGLKVNRYYSHFLVLKYQIRNKAAMNLVLTFTIALGVVASKAFGINKLLDINEVVRAQMENLIQEYNARKMTEGHVYESLRDENSLQSIRNELLNSFRKTAISTGKKLSEQKLKNGKSAKTVAKSTNRKNVAKAPIRRRRMELLQKHYGQTFETPKSEWSRHLARYH